MSFSTSYLTISHAQPLLSKVDYYKKNKKTTPIIAITISVKKINGVCVVTELCL
jgi:hypothetical protein